MSRYGEIVNAEIIESCPSTVRNHPITGTSFTSEGYCVIEILDECDWGFTTYILRNGSVGGIPISERTTGVKGKLKWSRVGNYEGPIWISTK